MSRYLRANTLYGPMIERPVSARLGLVVGIPAKDEPGLVTALDHNIGRILTALEAAGLSVLALSVDEVKLRAIASRRLSKLGWPYSAGFATLAEKKAFLEQYVTFRRNYEELDFDISFIDGGDGRVPGPTEWDVRVRAKVPSTDLADWVSGMTMTNSADKDWVSSIPHAPIELDAFQWYDGDGRLVGISPDERIVLYRNLSN